MAEFLKKLILCVSGVVIVSTFSGGLVQASYAGTSDKSTGLNVDPGDTFRKVGQTAKKGADKARNIAKKGADKAAGVAGGVAKDVKAGMNKGEKTARKFKKKLTNSKPKMNIDEMVNGPYEFPSTAH